MAFLSALGLRGRVPVPPPFLLVPSRPPPPDAHRPRPAGPQGARVLWSAGRSHTERTSPTLLSSPQTTSPDRLALPPQGPGGRWGHLGSQAGCRGLVPSFSLRPAALRVPPIRPPAWPRCQEGAVRLSTQGRAGVRGRPARAGGLVMGLVGLAFPILHARAWRLCVFTRAGRYRRHARPRGAPVHAQQGGRGRGLTLAAWSAALRPWRDPPPPSPVLHLRSRALQPLLHPSSVFGDRGRASGAQGSARGAAAPGQCPAQARLERGILSVPSGAEAAAGARRHRP